VYSQEIYNSVIDAFAVNFRFISGEISAEKKFLEDFYCAKRFVFEFQWKSLGLFLSYHAHFRRYQQFGGFWQSTATSSHSCEASLYQIKFK